MISWPARRHGQLQPSITNVQGRSSKGSWFDPPSWQGFASTGAWKTFRIYPTFACPRYVRSGFMGHIFSSKQAKGSWAPWHFTTCGLALISPNHLTLRRGIIPFTVWHLIACGSPQKYSPAQLSAPITSERMATFEPIYRLGTSKRLQGPPKALVPLQPANDLGWAAKREFPPARTRDHGFSKESRPG